MPERRWSYRDAYGDRENIVLFYVQDIKVQLQQDLRQERNQMGENLMRKRKKKRTKKKNEEKENRK